MADNIPITPGSGKTVATDEVIDGTLGTVQVQFIKVMDGTLDSTNKLSVSAGGAAKVDGSAVTQPISAASLPLPTGASTSANQTTGNSSLSSIDTKTATLVSGRVPVDPSGVTSPVSVASLPLPSGASTEATLLLIKAKTDNLDVLLSTRTKPADTQIVTGPLTDTQLRASPVPISGSVTTGGLTDTQLRASPVPVSGTVTITDGSGPVTVDGTITANAGTNLNTSALLLDATFTGRINTLGQKIMANSTPIAIASDQTAIPINDNSGSLTVDNAGTFAVQAAQSGTWTVQPGNTPNTSPWLVENRPPTTQTYAASMPILVPVAAGATDIFTLTGSATKIVKLLSVHIAGNATTAVTVPCLFIKRSAANTGGTSTAPTVVPHDSNNAAGTATVLAYTANPTALGAVVGTLDAFRLDLPTSASAANGQLDENFDDGQPYVLRGTSQLIAVNLNSTAIAGGSLSIGIHWTEE